MRTKAFLIVVLALSGCSRAERDGAPMEAAVSESSDTARGPGIGVTAAPGVAFRYAYHFRLPVDRIARTQEAHAQACESLGIARCRITAMHYAVDRGGTEIGATLDFKLDPSIARKFGTAGVEAVAKSGGKVASVDISGTDASGAITAIDEANARQRADLGRIEQELAKLSLKSPERLNLRDQAEALRVSLQQNAASKTAQQQSLATTPMHFDYGTSDMIAGFDPGSLIGTALSLGSQSFLAAFSLLTILLAGGLPWAVIGLAAWWLWRWLRVRLAPVAAQLAKVDQPAI